jgi:hypothetical protein
MSDGDDGQRDEEMETLEAIFLPEQLTISTAAPYYFTIQLNLDAPPIDSDCGGSGDTGGEGGGGLGGDCSADDGVACTLTISLPLGYPVALPLEVTVDCPMITGKRGSELIPALHDAVPVDGEPKVWEMCEWLRGNAHLYFTAPRLQQPRSVPRAVAEPEPVRGGFMREWCSFVSLYVTPMQTCHAQSPSSINLPPHKPPPPPHVSRAHALYPTNRSSVANG